MANNELKNTDITGTLTVSGAVAVTGAITAAAGRFGPGTLSPSAAADDLVVEKATGTMGMSLLSGDASPVYLLFGDNADVDIGRIVYVHATDSMSFYTNNAEAIRVDATQHLAKIQATAPTSTLTSTVLNAGGGSGAAIEIGAGSTDQNGSITITAGDGTPTSGIAGQIVFNSTYVIAPKAVILQAKDADAVDLQPYISSLSGTAFQISLNAAMAASEVAEWYYWVI
jgi:hypothetical protein